jgi:DNA-binding PadR family transcriptional regulator
MVESRVCDKKIRLSEREQLMIVEIGTDIIDSASGFVSYLSDVYGFSKSSVWYNLNRLKEIGVLDFATKDAPGKSLRLTAFGAEELKTLEKVKTTLIERFSEMFLNRSEQATRQEAVYSDIRVLQSSMFNR